MTCQTVIDIPVAEGKYEELRGWLRQILPDSRAFHGSVSVEVYRDQNDPSSVVLLEKWNSRADYDAYLAWRGETGMIEQLSAFMDGELRIRVLDPAGV